MPDSMISVFSKWHLLATAVYLAVSAQALSLAREPLDYAVKHAKEFETDLLRFASFPSISALPQHIPDIEAAAGWLKDRLEKAGLENTKILPTAGPQPVVYGDWLHAPSGSPTVLIYGHYDVQPVDPLNLWDAPPFEPNIKGGFFWGRGVDDDKGGLIQAVHAVEAWLRTVKKLPVNVKFLLEGQEEVGSPHLGEFLQGHKELLAADLALSADGGQITAEQPGISTGLRGAAGLQVDLTTAGMDLHSGMKGGSVQNAAHALVQLLSTLRNPDTGVINVKGFYDDVRPVTDEDRKDMEVFAFDEEEEKAALGVLGFMGEEGCNTLERRWLRPTLEIVGMTSGFTGEGMKTVIPAKAMAKLSARLVPDMEPADIAEKVRKHLELHAPPFTHVNVSATGFRAHPWTSAKATLGNQAAAKVLAKVMPKPPIYTKDGGTIPALAYFQNILGVPSTVFGFGLGDHIHAPNERLLVDMFHLGRKAWVMVLEQVAEDWKDAGSSGGKGQKEQAAGEAEAAKEEL